MKVETVWEDALAHIETRVPRHVYDTWFIPLNFNGIHDSSVQLGAPNKFFGDWLTEHYGDLMSEAFAMATGREMKDIAVMFIPDEKTAEKQPSVTGQPGTSPTATGRSRKILHLNPKYSFTSFVVGASNQFAYAACRAVADAPAKAYNPLFIYGQVGLGKTHLLKAIGNHLAERSDMRIAYVTTEQFTNEVINSIRYDKMMELRKRYRNIDMLLVDDVQFLAGKERTQEEFFHTFNTLYEAQKQIVLSSDRFPKDMPDMEERLRSRFEWGLIADLQSPDIETRIAILRKKSDDEGIGLPEEVIQYLASTMKNNIRELEGSLVRLGAYSSLTGQPIAMDMAKNVLRDIIGDKRKVVTMDDIEEAVAERFHLKISEMKSHRRSKTLVHPRQIAMYLCRELTNSSFPEIGRHFGGKDHTTIIHACKQIAKAKEADLSLRSTLESLTNHITKG
jgi:chromosomal replication initiator protein